MTVVGPTSTTWLTFSFQGKLFFKGSENLVGEIKTKQNQKLLQQQQIVLFGLRRPIICM